MCMWYGSIPHFAGMRYSGICKSLLNSFITMLNYVHQGDMMKSI